MVTLDQSLNMYSYYFGLRWQKISSSRKVTFFRMRLNSKMVYLVLTRPVYFKIMLTSIRTSSKVAFPLTFDDWPAGVVIKS